MSYIESVPGESPNSGRVNTNTTLRSLATQFYGDIPPTSFTTDDGVDGPFPGMTWNSSNVLAPGVHMYVPGANSSSIHGSDWTRIGVANRVESSYDDIVMNVQNNRYEVGELVALINEDAVHVANNTVYLIRSNTNNETALVNILSSALKDASILSVHVAPNAIDSSKIAPGAVVTDKIRNDAVTKPKVAPATIDGSKLENEAVETSKIADLNVTREKIADDAVDGDKIADDAVRTQHIDTNAVTGPKIATAAVENSHIPNREIPGSKLEANAVGLRELNITGPANNNYVVAATAGSNALRLEPFESYTDIEFYFNNNTYEKVDLPDDIWRMDVYMSNVKNRTGNADGVLYMMLGTANGYGSLSSSTNLNTGGYTSGGERAEFFRYPSYGGNTICEYGMEGEQTMYGYTSMLFSDRGFIEYTVRHDRKLTPTSNTFYFGGALLAKAYYGEPITRILMIGGSSDTDAFYTPAHQSNVYQGNVTIRYWREGQ